MYRTNVNWNEAAATILSEAKADTRRTYEEIAADTGLSHSTVRRYLAGTRAVPVQDFVAIARALGRDPLVLFSEVEAWVQQNQ